MRSKPVSLLPLSVMQFLMVRCGLSRRLPHVGGTGLLAMGLVIALCGMIGLRTVGLAAQSRRELALPIALLGLGTGAALVPLATNGVSGVDTRHSGAAAGFSMPHTIWEALWAQRCFFLRPTPHANRPSMGRQPVLASRPRGRCGSRQAAQRCSFRWR